MKSALARLTSMPRKGEFWQWWGGITLAEKILFGLWATIELVTLLFMLLIGLDWLVGLIL
tara:strand:- start:3221 stop:3400 length:180 start_codon:yes stop_codon:yes gene_type:complete